jgi:hypothetical protein
VPYKASALGHHTGLFKRCVSSAIGWRWLHSNALKKRLKVQVIKHSVQVRENTNFHGSPERLSYFLSLQTNLFENQTFNCAGLRIATWVDFTALPNL